jgi:hypothetical protein
MTDLRAASDSPFALTRRELLHRSGTGLGMLALAGVMGDAGVLAGGASDDEGAGGYRNPLAPKVAHFPAKAKRVIHLFMNGGPSHLDTFDPKPSLQKYAGQPVPSGNLKTERKTAGCYPSPFKFQKYGESGIEVSELFQHTAKHIDDIAVIRSMHADVPNHEPSLLLMNCGESRLVRPSMGSWLTYGLGTDNLNLPGFIAMCPNGYPIQETQNWQAAFLPGVYQGTYVNTKHEEIDKLVENVRNGYLPQPAQRRQLDALAALNRRHAEQRGNDPALEARIHSFELPYRMQQEAAEAFDVRREPKHVLESYGKGTQARQILIARRLIERGVRFVQVWSGANGASGNWDNHTSIIKELPPMAAAVDQPTAALLADLKARGLFSETLLLWNTEFGRMPFSQGSEGRDHNGGACLGWMAGAGVRRGVAIGETDDWSWRATKDITTTYDFHATVLHLLGLDHEQLAVRHNGANRRLTDVHGHVVQAAIS